MLQTPVCEKMCFFVKQEIPSERNLKTSRQWNHPQKRLHLLHLLHRKYCSFYSVQPDCSYKNCINGEKRAEENKKNSFFIMPIIISVCSLSSAQCFFYKICYSFVSLMNRNLREKYDTVGWLGREEVHIKQKQNNFNLRY